MDAILSCHGHREIDGTMMRLYQLAAPLLIIRPVLNCQCSGMVGGVMRIGSFDGVTWRTGLEKPILPVRECVIGANIYPGNCNRLVLVLGLGQVECTWHVLSVNHRSGCGYTWHAKRMANATFIPPLQSK